MQSDVKQLEFDVVDNLRKISFGRKLLQRLLTFTFDKNCFSVVGLFLASDVSDY